MIVTGVGRLANLSGAESGWTAGNRSGLRRRQSLEGVMATRLQTLGWGTWALILALIALLVLAIFLVTPAS